MYTEHFGLKEPPFSIAPNPQYLYMSQRHQDALAHLFYGIQSDGGFILLTGEVGTGKTTLCRYLLNQIPEDVETAFVLNPRVTATELLATICDEFGAAYHNASSIKDLVDALNNYLLSSHSNHKKAVLIIDEAQNLTTDLLEQLRLLTNLETSERKLLQIILLGQPELLEMLSRDNLRQFSQRITARFHLEALNRSEASAYITHRLDVGGGKPELIDKAARRRVFKLSQGIPRVMNLICDRALLGAYAQDKKTVSARIVSRAAKEVLGIKTRRSTNQANLSLAAGLIAGLATITALLAIWLYNGDAKTPLWNSDIQTPTTEEFESNAAAELVTRAQPKPNTESNQPLAVDGTPSTNIEPLTQTPKITPAMQPLSSPKEIAHLTIEAAYHDLFALWGSAFEDRTTPACELASVIGLGCYRFAGPLSQLERLNRPAIVAYNEKYLTLTQTHDQVMTFIAADQQTNIDRAEFAKEFSMQAELFWRMPPGYERPLELGDTGPAVDWLVIQLALINDEAPTLETGSLFDQRVAERLRQFQFSKGLPATGKAGPLTWIHINSIQAGTEPVLSDRKKDKGGEK